MKGNGKFLARIWAKSKEEASDIKNILIDEVKWNNDSLRVEEIGDDYKPELNKVVDDWDLDDILDIKYQNAKSFSKRSGK